MLLFRGKNIRSVWHLQLHPPLLLRPPRQHHGPGHPPPTEKKTPSKTATIPLNKIPAPKPPPNRKKHGANALNVTVSSTLAPAPLPHLPVPAQIQTLISLLPANLFSRTPCNPLYGTNALNAVVYVGLGVLFVWRGVVMFLG